MPEEVNIPSTDNPEPIPNPNIIDNPLLGFDGFNQFNYEDVIDRLSTFADEDGVSAFGVDEEFKRSVDAAAVHINKYSIGNMGNVNTPYPGDATTTYNPFTQQSPPDLGTQEGRRRYMQSAEGVTKQVFPAKTPGYQNPIETGIKSSNFDRYYNHPKFAELGWHPYANNEEHYNKNSTIWDDFGRSVGEFGNIFGTGFLSVYRSIDDIFDEQGYFTPDIESAMEFEDAMRIGNSTRGGVGGFIHNLALNSGYTFGIIGSIAVEELAMAGATALSGGILAPATAARTAFNIGKLGKHIANSLDIGRVARATKEMMTILKNSDKAKDFFTLAHGGRIAGKLFTPETLYAFKSIKTARQAGTNLSNIAKGNKIFGGFYRDLRAINLAMAESKLEAGMVYNKMLNNRYNEHKRDNDGLAPSNEELEEINDYSKKAAFAATMWNFPLIYITNKLVLEGALRGFKPMGRVLDETMSGIGSRVLRNKKALKGSTFYDAGKWKAQRLYNLGIKGSARAFGAGALRYSTVNFAEGFQEIGQEAIAVGTEDYYTGLFKDPAMAGAEAFQASVSSAVSSQISHQGLEVFMSGFLMGGLVQGPQKAVFEWIPAKFQQVFSNKAYQKNKQAKEDYVNSVVTTLNDAWDGFMADPAQYFDEGKLNSIAQKQLSEEMKHASFDSDALAYMDAKDHSIFQQLYTMAASGKMYEFRDQIESFTNMSDEDLIGAFPEFKADVKNGKMRERFGNMLTRSEEIEKSYKELNDKYVNPFDRYKYVEGTKEYNVEATKEMAFNHAKFLMMFTKNTFERALQRSNQIYTELSANPIVSKISASEIALFTNLKNLKTEMEVLTSEIKLEAITSEEKKIEAEKVKRLELLQNYFDVLTHKDNITKNSISPKNPFGLFDRRKIGALKKPFVAILKDIAEQQDDFVNSEEIDKTLKDIIDYKYLKGRIQDYHKAIDTLIEPGRLDLLSDKISTIMYSMWENRKKDYENRIRKYIKTKEQNEFLNQLAKIGIYPKPDDAEMFLSDGAIPQNYMDEAGDVTQTSDPNKYQTIQNLILEYRKSITDPEEVKVSGEEEVGNEPDFDSILDEVEDAPGVAATSVKISEGTQEVLALAYGHYRETGGKQTPEVWGRSTEATNIRKARAAVEQMWIDATLLEAEGELDPSQEEIDEIKLKGVFAGVWRDFESFEVWFKINYKDPDVYKAYNKHGNLKYSNLSIEGLKSKELSQDKLGKKEQIAGDDRGYYVVETIYTDDVTKIITKYYEVVDSNNNNVFDKWKHVVTSLKPNYLIKGDAIKDLKMIQANLAKKSKFKWAGEEFETGALVQDKKGNVWEVISNSQTIKKFGNLAIVPFTTTGERKIKTLKTDQWKKGVWTFHNPDFSTVTPANEGMVKLRIGEAIQFYPHVLRDEGEKKPAAYQRFYKFLSNLTPTELNSLVIQVSRNPKWVEKPENVDDMSALVYDERIIGRAYKPNPQVKKGSEEFTIKLMIKNNPSLSAKYNAILKEGTTVKGKKVDIKPTDIIGYFQGPSGSTLLGYNTEGKLEVINPLNITAQQASETFWFYGDAALAAEQIKNNYASSFSFMEQVKEKLGNKKTVEVVIGDLNNVDLKISPGQFNYDKETPQPLSELEHNSIAKIDGKKIYWILDLRSSYDKAGKRQKEEQHIITNLDTEHVEYDKIDAAVDAAMIANKSWTPKEYLGRYIAVSKLPDGSYAFIELKAEELPIKEANQIIINIKNRQSETLKDNVTIIDEDANDREPKNQYFNHTFNIERTSEMYIAGKPGELIDIEIESRSDIKIRYKNKNKVNKEGKAWKTSYTISTKQMEAVDDIESFVELVNFIVETKDNERKKNEQSGLKLKVSDFRRGIPKRTNLDDIIQTTTTTLQNPIKKNQRLEAHVNDSAELEKWKNTTVVPEEPVEEPEEEGDEVVEEVAPAVEEEVEDTTIKTEEQDKIDIITNLEEEIKEYRQGLMASVKAERLAEENEDGTKKYTLGQANSAAMLALQNEPALLKMEIKLQQLKDNVGYKILRTFDGNDVEDINVFIDWATKNLPDFIHISDIKNLGERLAANGITVGAFVLQLKNIAGNVDVGGTIYTGATSPYRYHEAFHSVFRMLLSDKEIKNYLKLAKKEARAELRKEGTTLAQALENLKKLHPIYEQMTSAQLEERYYEEYLADEFEKFKKNPQSTQTDSANKSLFQKIWEWIKRVFKRFTKNELLQLYQNIDSGKFKNTNRQSNKFTNAIQGGVTSVALAQAIPIDTITITRKDAVTGKEKKIFTNIYLPADQSRKLISTIGALYLNKERKWGSKPEQKNRNIPTKDLLNEAIADVTAMYDPMRPFYTDEENGIDYLTVAPKLKRLHDALIRYETDIKKSVIEYLNLFNVQYDQERYNEQVFEDDFGLRTTEQWDKDVSMIGGFTSLSIAIRKFIATTSVAEADEFGNEVVDPEVPENQQETLIQAVDYVAAYNGLLKAVKNTKNPMQILQKMHWFGEGNPETNAVVNRIFTEIGVTRNDIEAGRLPKIKNELFFQSILKGFNQFRVDYIFVHTDLKGRVHLYAANNRDDSYAQLEIWSQAFDIKKDEYERDSKKKKQIVKFFNTTAENFADIDGKGGKKSMSNGVLEKKSKQIAIDLYNKTGISLSPLYISYSIARGFDKVTAKQEGLVAANNDVNPILWEDVYEMGAAIQRGEHLFLNIKGEGSSTRLTKLAVANGLLDENVGATVFLNPEGNYVYAHQMPTYHLEKVAELNDTDALEQMKKGDVFLQRNMLLRDKKFQALAREGKLRVLRLAGSKVSDLTKDDETGAYSENNLLDINKNKGVTYGASTPKQFILDLINVYTHSYNRENQKVTLTEYTNDRGEKDYFTTAPVLIRVLEAGNTGDFTPLPVIKSVVYDEEGNLTPSPTALTAAINELENEYLRIKREANEESDHTSDTYQGYNDSAQGRAFKLFFTGNLVTKRTLSTVDRTVIRSPSFGSNNKTKERILEGSQKLLIRRAKGMVYMGLRAGNKADVVIGKGDEAVEFVIKNKGLMNIDELDSKSIFDGLGTAIRPEGSKKDKIWNHEIKIGQKSLWTDTKGVADFLNGVAPKYVYELVPKDEVTEVGFVKKKVEAFGKEDLLEDYSQTTGEVIGGEPAAPAEDISKLPIQKRIQALIDNGTIVSTSTHNLGGRFPIIININGVPTPFYRSSVGTEGKVKGNWYPFFGFGKNKNNSWLIKGPVKDSKEGYGIAAIQEMMEYLNNTLNWDHSIDKVLTVKKHPFFNVLTVVSEEDFNKEVFGKDVSNINKKTATDFIREQLNKIEEAPAVPAVEEPVYDPVLYEKDTAIKEALEESAVNGDTFKEALEKLNITEEDLQEMIAERMMTEFKEFEILVGGLKADTEISEDIKHGLISETGKVTEEGKKSMEALNLREEDPGFNLAQVFFNDWLNTKSFNDLLLGDQAMTLKNAIDQIKRAKMQNAAGPSAASIIAAPKHGIDHPNQHISLLSFDDPEFKQKYGVFEENTKPGEEANAQVYGTVKAFRYMWFGIGQLSIKQVELLDKIEKGEWVSSEEFWGNVSQGMRGFKDDNAMTNSKKFVYGDGKTYLKFSLVTLSKELTSRLDENGNWIALETRKELHNLRVKMEKWESETDQNGNLIRETIAIAGPASAIKMLKRNLTTATEAFSGNDINSENITDLDANYMRLQMVNPSNKLEIIDPTQIKTIITSEQKDSVEVWIGNKKMTVGQIRKAYHKSIADRVTLQYIGRRNLIFTLPAAMDELHKSINLGEITTDLRSFLRYALINLEASQVKTQMLEFFSLDLTGEPKYDLNNSLTMQKFQELFLSYFSKGVLQEHMPGHSLSLVSGKGMKVWKKVIAIDEETGQPSRWEIVRTDEWVAMDTKDKNKILNAKSTKLDWDNTKERTFSGLKVGDYYIDGLRANVKAYKENGEEEGDSYSEMMMPAHFRSVMDNVIVTNPNFYKSKEEILSEWWNWAYKSNWSPEAQQDIVRSDIEDFDPARSRKEFADWKNYPYNGIKDEFGDNGNNKSQKIPDVVGKMFSIRIPSQDKHSAVNVMLVDFLPVFYGSSAVFPEDLIEISGADFDIDKVYTQIKDFYNEGRNFYEYGKATTEEGQYADYIRYIIKQGNKKGNVISDALEAWNEKLPGNLGDKKGIISRYLTEDEIADRIGLKPEVGDPEYHTYVLNYSSLVLESMLEFAKEADETLIKLWETKKTKDLMGALETLQLPVTRKEYKEYKKKHDREPYVGAMNNDVLDYKFALLGHKGMTEPQDGRRIGLAFEPADVKALTDLWDWMAGVKDEKTGEWIMEPALPEFAETVKEEGIDVDNLLGKALTFKNNKEGSRSIGAVVLPNIVMSLLSEHNIKIRSKKKGRTEEISQLRLNGHTYKNFNIKYEINPETGKEIKTKGLRSQYVLSALITAMTDNAKERLSAKLGLNKDALAVVTNLVALGVGIRTAILLINQPSIKEAYISAIDKEKPRDPGVAAILRLEIDQMDKDYGDEVYLVPVTDKQMIHVLRKEENVDLDMDDIRFKYSAIKQFLTAHEIKTYTSKMLSLVKLTKGMGRDTEAINQRDIDIRDLGIDLTDSEFATKRDADGNLIPIDVRKIFNEEQGATSWQSRFYTIYKEFTQQLLPSVFLTRTPDFIKMKDVVLANLTNDSFYMSPYRVNQIEKDLLSYITIKAYMRALSAQGNDILKRSLENGFIYDQKKQDGLKLNDVVSRIKKYLKGKEKKNYFIEKYVYQDKATDDANNSGVNRLRSNTWTKMSDSQIVNIQNSFLELYSDLNTREDAIHLVHYVLVKDAMQYKGGTILDAIPAFMFDNLLQQVKSTHNAFNLKTKTEEAFKRVLGSSLPELYNEFVDGYLSAQNNYWLLKKMKIDDTSIYNPKKYVSTGVKRYGANIRKVAQDDENSLYVFADNATGTGKVGQQLLRGIPNAKPLHYKLNVGYSKSDYYNDAHFTENVQIIDENINDIQKYAKDNAVEIIFPDNILANTKKQTEAEVARMKKYMPKTLEYLQERIKAEFGYNITTGVSAKLKIDTEALMQPVHINMETKKLIVDLYKGLGVYTDKETGVRKMKRWAVKKKKGEKRAPAWKVALGDFSTLKKNMSKIMKKGWNTFDTESIEGKNIARVGFPYMVRVNVGGVREEWRYYKLETVWGNKDSKTTDFVSMIEDGDLMAYGNRAEYVEMELNGTFTQNPIGFVYGKEGLPTNAEVNQFVDDKNETIGIEEEPEILHDEENLAQLQEDFEQQAIENAVIGADEIIFDEDNIIVRKGETKGNIADASVIKKIQDKIKEESQPVEKSDVISEEEAIDLSANFEEEVEGRGQPLSEGLKKLIKSNKPTHSVITNWWNKLERPDRAKVRNALGIQTLDGVIDEFTSESNTFTEEEFINDIKLCHLK